MESVVDAAVADAGDREDVGEGALVWVLLDVTSLFIE